MSMLEKLARKVMAERRNAEAATSPCNGEQSQPDAGPQWPEPLAAEAFYGLAGKVVRAIEPHTEADQAALLVQFLVAFGNRIGRTAHFKVEGDTHYLNLFAVLVGRTSKGRKGTSWGRIRQYMELVEPDWITNRVKGGLASGEGLVDAVRDPVTEREPIRERGRVTGYQDVETDPGEPDKRLLCLEEEYAGVLRMLERPANSLSQRTREAWQGRAIGSLTKNSKTRCQEPHISIVGHVTVEEVRRYLSESEMANGFGNRHLWLCVQRSKCLPDGSVHVPSAPLVDAVRAAADFAVGAGELRRDSEARRIWYEVYPQLSEGKPGMTGAMLGRAEAQVMRLACLYAVLDHSEIIEPVHLFAGLALWDYCEASVRYIFGDSLGDLVADELLRALRANAKGMTREEIRDLFGRHRRADEIGRALNLLSQLGLARMVKEATRGRSAERWLAVTKPATEATDATKDTAFVA